MTDDLDEQAFEDFLNESRELLGDLDPALLKLEENPDNPDYVEEPFRILHSLKGMSSFFGLTPIKRISHSLEDLLGEIRDGRLEVREDITEILFRGSEHLSQLYDEIFSGKRDIELSQNQLDLLETIEKTIESGEDLETYVYNLLDDLEQDVSALMESSTPEVQEEVDDIARRISQARRKLRTEDGAEDEDSGSDLVNEELFDEDLRICGEPVGQSLKAMESICRSFVTEDGDEYLDDLDEPAEAFHEAFESFRNVLRENDVTDVSGILEEMENEYERFMESAGFGELLAGSLLEHLGKINDRLDFDRGDTETSGEPGDAGSTVTPGDQADVSRTFRVEEEKVDDFMEYVGELIVTGEMYKHLEAQIKRTDIEQDLKEQLRNTNQAFRDLSTDLRESLMGVRRLKIRNLLKKYPVMVRKLAGDLDKDIEVTLKGEETPVDKIFIEELETPLTHLVRNAVDHGIEPRQERKDKGKDPTGRIDISVESTPEELQITIEDYGAGLDVERIRNKIVDRGLASETESLNLEEDEVFQYIFRSGFSTTDEVTDVSGRGVGMNDVKKTIEELNGSIEIHSELDRGTEITMTLPRSQSVNVIDTLVIEVENQQFAIPLEKIIESISLSKAGLKTVEDKGEMIEIRNSLFPLFRLRDLFELGGDTGSADAVAMLLENGGDHFAILADVLGKQQKVVVKDMGPVFRSINYAAGAAVMGNGDICLVLDVNELGRRARERGQTEEARR
ncbi:MAG: chemotaxis protein CheA [bacterium]